MSEIIFYIAKHSFCKGCNGRLRPTKIECKGVVHEGLRCATCKTLYTLGEIRGAPVDSIPVDVHVPPSS